MPGCRRGGAEPPAPAVAPLLRVVGWALDVVDLPDLSAQRDDIEGQHGFSSHFPLSRMRESQVIRPRPRRPQTAKKPAPGSCGRALPCPAGRSVPGPGASEVSATGQDRNSRCSRDCSLDGPRHPG
jgi:hypothetical protein